MKVSNNNYLIYNSKFQNNKTNNIFNDFVQEKNLENSFDCKISKCKSCKVDNFDPNKKDKVIDLYGPNAPKKVVDAWNKTLEELGLFDLGMDENGDSHVTRIEILIAIKREHNDSCSDLLGNSVDSAIKTIEKALSMLNNPIEIETDPIIIERKNVEKQFYIKVLEKLR